MENKDFEEIEKKLQEAADQVQIRDFDEIWQEVQAKHSAMQKPKKPRVWKWIPAVATAAVVFVVGIIMFPKIFPNSMENSSISESTISEESSDSVDIYGDRYSSDALTLINVAEQEFYNSIQNINVVDLSQYDIYNYMLYQTVDYKTMGGKVELYNDENVLRFFLDLKFYDESVILKEKIYEDYTLTYTTESGAEIIYKLKSYSEEDGTYVYNARASYGTTNYVLEYTAFTDNVTEFFEELFQ